MAEQPFAALQVHVSAFAADVLRLGYYLDCFARRHLTHHRPQLVQPLNQARQQRGIEIANVRDVTLDAVDYGLRVHNESLRFPAWAELLGMAGQDGRSASGAKSNNLSAAWRALLQPALQCSVPALRWRSVLRAS